MSGVLRNVAIGVHGFSEGRGAEYAKGFANVFMEIGLWARDLTTEDTLMSDMLLTKIDGARGE